MKRFLVASIIFVVLSAAATVAQEKVTVRWHRTAPEKEAFAVLMPEPPLRVRRVIPFSEDLKLATPVHEVATRGVLFSVFSIDKKSAAVFSTPEDFANGLRHAIQFGSRVRDGELTFEQEVSLNNQTAKQYLMRAEGKEGTVRVYETATHYYVLMTLGARASELLASNFFNSFSLDPRRARAASDKVSIIQDFSWPAVAGPEPLWPVAESSSPLIGPVGPVGPVGTESGSSTVTPSDAGRQQPLPADTVSGGVLNGKANKKPQPVYPPIAAAARAQGVVVVQVTVDEEGYVISAQATSGHPLLQQAAVKAARQARFAPTRLEGRPVKVRGIITYNFVLEPAPSEPPTRKY